MSKVGDIFGGADIPDPAPPPPPPTRQDPEIADARKRQQQAELRRKGRAASILTSGQGTEDDLGVVSRPQASGDRAAQLLGG